MGQVGACKGFSQASDRIRLSEKVCGMFDVRAAQPDFCAFRI